MNLHRSCLRFAPALPLRGTPLRGRPTRKRRRSGPRNSRNNPNNPGLDSNLSTTSNLHQATGNSSEFYNNGWDIPGEDTDTITDAAIQKRPGRESGDAASDKDDDSSATKAAVAAQVVRQELTQARTNSPSDLLEEGPRKVARQSKGSAPG